MSDAELQSVEEDDLIMQPQQMPAAQKTLPAVHVQQQQQQQQPSPSAQPSEDEATEAKTKNSATEATPDAAPRGALFEMHGKTKTYSKTSFGMGASSSFRRSIVWLHDHPRCDKFILYMIFLNSIILAFVDYGVVDDEGVPSTESWRNALVETTGYWFTVVFTIECMIKVIGMGFVWGRGAYLRDAWNILDFVVVVAGVVEVVFPDAPNVSILRTFRVLRPLRSLSSLPGLRLLIVSLLASIPDLANVVLLLMFTLLIFGILGMQLWMGTMHARCRSFPHPVLVPQATMWPTNNIGSTSGHNVAGISQFADVADMNDDAQRGAWLGHVMSLAQEDGVWKDDLGGFRCLLDTANDDDTWTQSSSPWSEPQPCIWPLLDPDDGRICTGLSNSNGNYHCPQYIFPELQRDSPNYDKAGRAICGSNFDLLGNPRFLDWSIMQSVFAGVFTGDLNWGYTNFDHMGGAFLTIFQAVTMEGWVDIMYQLQDVHGSTSVGIVFIMLIVFGSFVVLNLVLAVLCESLDANEEEEEEEDTAAAIASDAADGPQDGSGAPEGDSIRRVSVQIEEQLTAARKGIMHSKVASLTGLANNKHFSAFIIFLILANTVVLAMDHHPMTEAFAHNLELVNFALTVCFTIEMCIKMLGLGLFTYSEDQFNLFDCFIVLVSWVEFISIPPFFISGKNGGGGAISALRTFRLFRVFKLARDWPAMKILLETIVKTLHDIVNFAVLLLLFMYIFSLVGMQFLANKMHFHVETQKAVPFDACHNMPNLDPAVDICDYDFRTERPRAHFDTMTWALTTIFQVLSGENWNTVMYDSWRAIGWGAVIYFLLLVIIGNFIVMNLFMAILLQRFEGNEELAAKPKSRDQMIAEGKASVDMTHGARGGSTTCAKCITTCGLESVLSRSAHKQAQKIIPEERAEEETANGEAGPKSAGEVNGNPAEQQPGQQSVAVADNDPGEAMYPTPKQGKPPRIVMLSTAFGCFTPVNPVRVLLFKLVNHPNFDNLILSLILFSSLTLAIDNPLSNPANATSKALLLIDVVMTVLFTLEMLFKIGAMGFLCQAPPIKRLAKRDITITTGEVVTIDKWVTVAREEAYLRNSWNVLDFVIVIVSVLSLAARNNAALSSLRSLRTLRVLRPLRMISRAPGLKLVVNALFRSVPAIINVVLICFLFMLIFAIMGVNYFKGIFMSCDGDVFESLTGVEREYLSDPWSLETFSDRYGPSQLHNATLYASIGYSGVGPPGSWIQNWPDGELHLSATDWLASTGEATPDRCAGCPTSMDLCMAWGGDWSRQVPQSFDNVADALGALFELSTTEGWVDVMYSAIDSTGLYMQPKRDNALSVILFFVLYIVVGSFFVMNLFVGVVIDNFNRMQEEIQGSVFLSAAQKEWVRTQQILLRISPIRILRLPEGYLRRTCHKMILTEAADKFIMCCILINTLFMAIQYFGQSQALTEGFAVCNIIFVVIFNIEMAMKLFALHPKAYFRDGWNRFDFMIVWGTNLGFAVPGAGGGVASVIRTFRVGRVFRLIQSAKSLRHLFQTLLTTIPALSNIGALLFLVVFIYSVLGVQIFSTVAFNDALNEHNHFQDFWSVAIMLIRCSTGENWNGLMYSVAANAPGCVPEDEFEFHANVCGMGSGNMGGASWQCANMAWWGEEVYDAGSNATVGGYGEMAMNNPLSLEQVLGQARLNDCCVPIYGCGKPGASFLYFLSFTLFVTYIKMNLFIAIVLDAFGASEEEEDTGNGMSEENFKMFARAWSVYDPDATLLLPADQLKDFLQNVDVPLGFGREYVATAAEIEKRIEALDINLIPADDGSGAFSVHFSEVARKLAKGVLLQLHVFEEVDMDHEINRMMDRKYKKAKKGVSMVSMRKVSQEGVAEGEEGVAGKLILSGMIDGGGARAAPAQVVAA